MMIFFVGFFQGSDVSIADVSSSWRGCLEKFMIAMMDMHPLHVRAATSYLWCGLKELFAALDLLDPFVRNDLLYLTTIKLGMFPDHAGAPWSNPVDLQVVQDIYRHLKEHCASVCVTVSEELMTQAFVLDVLIYAFTFGNVDGLASAIEHARSRAKQLEEQATCETSTHRMEYLQHRMKDARLHLDGLSAETKRINSDYHQFCEIVVRKLLR
jgi:hypothetical protein